MTRRMWALALSTWVAVVLVGSALTWLAIDRAGQQVTSSDVFSAITPSVSPTPRIVHTPRVQPKTKPSKPKPKATATPRQTQAPVTPIRSTPVAPVVKQQFGTWSGSAGTVTVSCQLRTARLVGASPNNGWQVERGDTSGTSVEVNFLKGTTQIQVQATCVNGAPAFRAEGSGGTGDN